jgi:hypothetical protein
MGIRRALLKTTPPTKPGEPPKEKSYMLTEHERLDDLEVLSIDEKAGAVKVNYAGIEISVNFKDNAVASTAPAAPAPPAPGVPGAPAQPGINPGVPGAPQPGFNPALRPQFPTRPVRGNGPAPGQPGAASNGGTGIGARDATVVLA